jgi:hypothetical protein
LAPGRIRSGSEKPAENASSYGRRMTTITKTMTCKQLGGPCDLPLQGRTADEIIKLQDKHLKDVVAGGDATHGDALAAMKGRWKHPLSGMKWYRSVKREFAALDQQPRA